MTGFLSLSPTIRELASFCWSVVVRVPGEARDLSGRRSLGPCWGFGSLMIEVFLLVLHLLAFAFLLLPVAGCCGR